MAWEHKTFAHNIGVFLEKLENHENDALINTLLAKYGHSEVSPYLLYIQLLFRSLRDQALDGRKVEREGVAKDGRLSQDKRNEIISDTDILLKRLDLGREWQAPLVGLLLTGTLVVPGESFYIARTDEPVVPDPHRLVLVLNPNTTLENIRKGFSQISKEQKKRSAGLRQPSYSIKSLINQRINFLRSPRLRMLMAAKTMTDEMTEYDSRILKDKSLGSLEERMRRINTSRQTFDRRLRPIRFRQALSVGETIKMLANAGRGRRLKRDEIKRLLISARQQEARRRKKEV